jgi:superfamily II DNA or RNA helicase
MTSVASPAAEWSPGSLVRARGRDWVLLPGSTAELLLLRPLGGADEDIAGVLPELEPVETATFAAPDPSDLGDAASARLLRSALRLGFRSSGGPFRSLGGLAVTPRSYQLVPLLMALRMETTRLLIADAVGVGKTIEAGLIIAELLAQGSIDRFTVLCSPALAPQWQRELADKFGLDAVLVLPSTAGRLERDLPGGAAQSLFEHHPYTVVSTDFIKSNRRRDEFLRTCPELVVVDEAHTCVSAADGRAARASQQRYALLSRAAADERRHLLLLTATPHSGKPEAFRALLGLLDPALVDLPEDLSGEKRRRDRERIARHVVQRQRGDITAYLGEDTPFPRRQITEETYQLTPTYRRLFDQVLSYARDTVRDSAGNQVRQRVRWWSVLALLRSLASSPAAAVDTLRNRAGADDLDSVAEADALGAATVLDLADEDEAVDSRDTVPGALLAAQAPARRLRTLAAEAAALTERADAKLTRATRIVEDLLAGGDQVVVFCRFIPTAEYVGRALRRALDGVTVEWVTGAQPPEERERRVADLGAAPKRVLVATDCLSEGVNLQDSFTAVVHYDLAWNPTRHEQREGRVDRFGQRADTVRAITLYGDDNVVDGLVLDVLLRRQRAIRNDTGVSVPVPHDSDAVFTAVLDGVLHAETGGQLVIEEVEQAARAELDRQWRDAADREKRSRSLYAQEQIKPDEVSREIDAIAASLGSPAEAERFTVDALTALRGTVTERPYGYVAALTGLPAALRDDLALPGDDLLSLVRTPPAPRSGAVLARTDPIVETLARYVLDTALDPASGTARPARRCGVLLTDAVRARTVLLLLRYRLSLVLPTGSRRRTVVAEEARILGFRGTVGNPEWLTDDEVAVQLSARPAANFPPDLAAGEIRRVLDRLDRLTTHLTAEGDRLAAQLLASHRRVREAAGSTGALVRRGLSVSAHHPPDVLGVYLHLPVTA